MQKNFKVNIGVVGRFHLFDLARQLKKFGVLNKLITTYPKFIVTRWGIPSQYVVSNFLLELLNRFNQLNFLKKLNFYSNILMKLNGNQCSYFNKNKKKLHKKIIFLHTTMYYF